MPSLISRVFAFLLLASVLVSSASLSSKDPCEFTCGDGKCISAFWQCDNVKDCSDGLDEEGCNYLHQCAKDEFMCKSQECVKASDKCNGVDDCADGSDERGCPEKDIVNLQSAEDFEHGMGHIEEITTTVAPTVKKAPIRASQCLQRNATLFFTDNDASVYRLRITDSLKEQEKIVENVADKSFITSLAYKRDIGELLFVTKRASNHIQAIKGDGKVHEFASHDSEHFGHIAVDPLTGNIYYAEDGFGIGVCDKDANNCMPLVEATSHEQRFRDLILHPRRGSMFWIQYDGSSSMVKIAGMDGRTLRHFGAFSQIYAIALDSENELLYVSEEDVIVQVNLRTMSQMEYAQVRASAMVYYNCDLFYIQRDVPALKVFDARQEDKLISALAGSSFALAVVPDIEKPFHFVNPCLRANCPELCLLTESSIEPESQCMCKICGEATVVEVGSSTLSLVITICLVLLLLTLIGMFLVVYFRLWPELCDRLDNLLGLNAHDKSNVSVGFNNTDLN